MPIGVFYTNVPAKNVPENFEMELSKVIAEILAKPLERVLVNVIPDQKMAYGGTSEPACLLNLWSIGVFDKERNPGYASKLYPFITESLGIKGEKIALLFHPIEAYQKAMPS